MGVQEVKDAIKQAPISSIIGHYIPLTKRGANYEGVCPFHQDSHPSLKVSDSKELYKCFACDAAGDSIRFVEQFRNLEFKEALIEMAGILGIPADDLKFTKQQQNPKYQMGQRVLTSANKIYLKYAKEKGREVFQDFVSKRGLKQSTVEKFELGLTPKENLLSSYLQNLKLEEAEKNLALNVAKEVKIIKEGKWGPYDTFRNRVTFPIWDQYGNIKGFGGRALEKDQLPKYLNSSDSFLFNKGNILYGLNFAKPVIREKDAVILVEGYMDTIAFHQHGFENAVAVMGVAISDQNVKLLTRMTSNIYFAMDSDLSGNKAMVQFNEKFMLEGVLPKILNFAPHKDPDEFLISEGKMAMAKLIAEAPNFLDYQIGQLIGEKVPEDLDSKLDILQKIYQLLSPVKESLLATERLVQAAEGLGIQSGREAILENYREFLKAQAKVPRMEVNKQRDTKSVTRAVNKPQAPEISKVTPEKEQTKLIQVERNILKMLVLHPNIMEDPKIPELLENISDNEVKRTLDWLFVILSEVEDKEFLNIVKSRLSSTEILGRVKDYIFGLLFTESFSLVDDKKRTKIVQDLIRNLKKSHLKKKLQELRQSSDHGQVNDILKQMSAL